REASATNPPYPLPRAADDKWNEGPHQPQEVARGGDGALETVKVVLGWLIDTVAGDDRTPHLASSSTAPGDPRRFPAIAPRPDNREGPRRLRGPLSEPCDNLGVPAGAGDAPQSQCPDLWRYKFPDDVAARLVSWSNPRRDRFQTPIWSWQVSSDTGPGPVD
ncbi:hypothetical protein THAOC_07182, partial [Thalassiosira oceanica]